MPDTITYRFSGGTAITLTLAASASNATGQGLGYTVTGVSGTYDGQTITGEVGSASSPSGTDAAGHHYDDAFYTSGAGYFGSTDGLDYYGIGFKVGSTDMFLFSFGGILYFTNDSYSFISATLTGITYNVPPIVTQATGVTATDAAPVALASAVAFDGDPLSLLLVSDADFAIGHSSLSLSNGSVVYTPGAITSANAGTTDTLTYAVIDNVTGSVTNETQSVTLANDAVFTFGDNTQIVLTLAPTPTDISDFGSAYAVTAISGTYDGQTITGEVGSPGQVGSVGTFLYDNAIFTTSGGGADGRNIEGIDDLGLAFAAGSQVVELSDFGGGFSFFGSNSVSYYAHQTSVTSNLQPVVTLAAAPTATDAAPTTLGTAAAAFGGNPLSVTLLSDAAFATGSSLAISNGTILYTPGLITSANAGTTDTLTYAVTDTVTGATIDETQTVTLANDAVFTFGDNTQIVLTLAAMPSEVSYAVTAISGTYDGQTITGEVGYPGQFGYAHSPFYSDEYAIFVPYDNAIFTNSVGVADTSNKEGIDIYGLAFAVGSEGVKLFDDDGSFAFFVPNIPLNYADLTSVTSNLQPVVTLAAAPTATDAAPTTLGTAAAAFGGNPLSVTLLSDAAFATGSSLAISNGTILYTPGLITSANAGTGDAISYAVTDTVTGASIDETQTVALALPCFARGTRLATAGGEAAVEALRTGDLVRTHAGALRPVRWIGHRRLDPMRHPAPEDVLPIRIAAGALANCVPKRDLLVSPDHALLVNGLLLPARLLLNGATITREAGVRNVTYFHVELESHDILLAEGAPAESYLDTGNRAAFADAGPARHLHPDFAGGGRLPEHGASMKLSTAPCDVEPVWRSVAARAEAMGRRVTLPQATTEADLRLQAAGRALRPVEVSGDRHVFVLPRGAGTIWLHSRAASPSELRPWLDDRRRLGVAVRRLVLHDMRGEADMPVDHPALTEGWHDPARDALRLWRWSNGRARVPVSPGTRIVEVHLAGQSAYPAIQEPLGPVSMSAAMAR